MLVRFVYGHNYWDAQEFDDDTSVDEIEEFYYQWHLKNIWKDIENKYKYLMYLYPLKMRRE